MAENSSAETTDEIQSETWIADLFLSLREGDEVYLNGRDRPFTVESREWDDRESGYWRYTLSGYGTEYSGIVSPEKKHSKQSVSSFKTDAGTEFYPTRAKRDPEGDHIVSDTRAGEWLEEAGIDVR